MKKTLAVILGVISVSAFAQDAAKYCGHTEAMQAVFAQDPEAKARIEKMNAELEAADAKVFAEGYKNYPNGYFGAKSNAKVNGTNSVQVTTYKIPMVFHVLHQNGTEKITPAQIQEQVAILNRDYNKQNADTANAITEFQSIIGNIHFEFYLASIDPNGNCTNGIVYHNDTNTDWTSGNTGPYTGTAAGKWNPTKYLNVYTVRSISSGAAGYTYLPGTFSTGSGKDCIVILNDYIGASGTSQTSHSRALTHEVGHWFNLQHTWGSTNAPGVACGNDGVSDTPITEGWDHCPLNAAASQVCTSGVSENYQNYMDYSYCSVMFTDGQATRMTSAITSSTAGRNNLWSSSNLIATGVSNPQPCIPDVGFSVVFNKNHICAGSTVQLQDSTWNTQVTSWNWSCPGGTPSSSTDSMPIIQYDTPGLYSVSYTATTSAGSANITKTDIIVVGSNTATNQNPLLEGFESITVPNSDWTIDNGSGGAGWAQTATAAATGTKSMMISNFTNSAGAVEVLYTPSYNLSSINAINPGGTTFTFKVAYQRKASTSSEKLQVFSSTNCGQSWSQRYSKSGSSLASVTGYNTSAFTPSSASDWRTDNVAVSALTSQTNVWFKFVFTSDANSSCQNIYIDDINITNSAVGIEEAFESQLAYVVYPNPSNGTAFSEFTLDKASTVKLELVDMLGRSVETTVNAKLPEGSFKYTFGKTTPLSAGVYMVRLNVDGKNFTKKLIVE